MSARTFYAAFKALILDYRLGKNSTLAVRSFKLAQGKRILQQDALCVYASI